MMKGAGRAGPSPETGSHSVSCSPSVPQAQSRSRHLLPNGHCSPAAPRASPFPRFPSYPSTSNTLCYFSWKSHIIAVPESSGQSQPTVKTLFVSFCSSPTTDAPCRAFCVLAQWSLLKSLWLSWKADKEMKLNSSR